MPENATKHRDSVRFSGDVSPNDSESHSYDVQEDATIEEVMVRFYPGPRLDLHVRPYVKDKSGRSTDEIDLIEYAGSDEFVAGDNDVWVFPTSESVTDEDEIVVDVENVDGTHTYDFVVDMTLDTEGGTQRAVTSILGGLSDRIRGVLA